MTLQRRTAPGAENAAATDCATSGPERPCDKSRLLPHPERRHLEWSELPEWMRDNKYILSGYRQPTNSFRKCFASWFYVHNETGNIMTHMAGALGFVVLCLTATQGLLAEFATIDWRDVTTLYMSLVGAVGCMGISALYHTVTCHSPHVQRAYNKCDYVGIVMFIVGSSVPICYYTLYCHPRLKMFYLALVFALGTLTVVLVVAPHFGTPDYRPIRVAIFIALGISAVIPAITHAYWLFGWEYILNAVQAPYMAAMGSTYILGGIIYGARVPERWWPGRFDYWFHSHQIFHVFVVVAAVFHYVGIVRALRWTHTVGHALCAV
ncbi:hypothetical protein GGI23_001368 [Coemansia sp. RSA 2559]|nr:hypothetical protein GGI23_001368 [Coemansia sp. RSA 2559]